MADEGETAMRRMLPIMIAAAGMAAAGAASAQGPACPVPADLPRPHAEVLGPGETRRAVPTTGYTLAMIWAPEACHTRPGATREAARPGDFSCASGSNRSRFTLHGLWPDGAGAGKWPQYCRPAALLSEAQLRAGLCDTPSVQLLQHEWAKHGSCVTGDPGAYLAEEHRLFRGVRQPAMAPLARRRDLAVRDVQAAFASANPGMSPDAVRVRLNKRGWMEEVWLCLGLDKHATRCAASQGGGAAADQPVRVAAPALASAAP